MRWIATGALALLLLLPGYWMVKNHPYQYVYFNELAGGTDNAYARYETDYWMTSVKQMCEWLAANDEKLQRGEEVIIHTNCSSPAGHYMKALAPSAKVIYTRYNDRHKKKGDYWMFISRFVNKELMARDAWPPAETVYTEDADGIILGAISKRNTYNGFEGAEAEKGKDFAKAEGEYKQAVQQNPKDEAAWLGLAMSQIQLRKFADAKASIDQLLGLSGTYVNGLYALALYYINTGDTAKAKETLEKITTVNYKFNASYFYLASIYGQEGQLDKALNAVELYDQNNGRAVQIYDIGIQTAQQLGNSAVQLYLQSKKAYFQSDGQNALNYLAQSLRINPDYKPAVDFDRQLQELIAKQSQQ